jgi:hypothetical protein
MPRQKSKPTTPNWAVELRSLLSAKTREPKGDGWMTTEEFAESLKISIGTAHQYLRRGLASGHLERFAGTAISSAGIRIQTWHRPVQGKRK